MEFQFSSSRIVNVGTADKDLKTSQQIRQLNLLALIMISLSLLFAMFYSLVPSSFFSPLNMLLFIALYGFTFYFSSRGICQAGAYWIICVYIWHITISTVFYLLIIPPVLIILLRDQRTAVKGLFNFFISLKTSFSLVQIIEKERSGVDLYDPLANTVYRRQIPHLLEREYKRCMGEMKPISFIMIDLDNLKKINATFGHEWGDKALYLAKGKGRNCSVSIV